MSWTASKKIEKRWNDILLLIIEHRRNKKKNISKVTVFFCSRAGIRFWLRFITINFHQYLNKLKEDVSNRFWLEKTFKVIEI